MRLFPLVYEHKHAHAYTHTRAHTHHPLPPEKPAMGFLRRAAHFRPLRAAAFAPPTAATALPPACSPFGDHRALHRRERLVDGAVGHDDVEQEEPPQVELGRERECTVREFCAPVKSGR